MCFIVIYLIGLVQQNIFLLVLYMLFMHYGITTRSKVLVTVSNVLKLRNYEKTGFLLPGIPLKLENDVCPVCMY